MSVTKFDLLSDDLCNVVISISFLEALDDLSPTNRKELDDLYIERERLEAAMATLETGNDT